MKRKAFRRQSFCHEGKRIKFPCWVRLVQYFSDRLPKVYAPRYLANMDDYNDLLSLVPIKFVSSKNEIQRRKTLIRQEIRPTFADKFNINEDI